MHAGHTEKGVQFLIAFNRVVGMVLTRVLGRIDYCVITDQSVLNIGNLNAEGSKYRLRNSYLE